MPIREIENENDAAERLTKFFPPSEYNKEYAALVNLLSRTDDFTAALESVSREIWISYNSGELVSSKNRFTRAVLNLSHQKLGFNNQMNVVLTDAANPQDFGQLIRDKLLWKDSFAPGHGEFAHSYQWLAGGLTFKWANRTGEMYKAVAGVKSTVPFFVKDEGPIRLRPAFLWEWLVDCTEYQPKFDDQARQVAIDWCGTQLDAWCANKTTNSWFIQAFFRGKDPDIAGIMDERTFDTNYKPRRGQGEALAAEIRTTFDHQITTFVTRFYTDLYPVRNALSNRCRNANTVTRLAKSRRTGNPDVDWFISYYEDHRSTTLQAREQRLNPYMIAAALQAGEGVALDVWAYLALIEEELKKPIYSNKKDFNTVKKAAAAALEISVKQVGRSIEPLQAIDVGKQSVKANYATEKNREAGWKLKDPGDVKRSLYVKAAGGDVKKELKPVAFHKQPGVINAAALG
jgi:hypothetical protein